MCSRAPNAWRRLRQQQYFLFTPTVKKRNKLAVWAPARTVRFHSCDHLGLKTAAEQKDSLKSSDRLNNKDKGE